MNKPKITAVIVAKNEEKVIEDALKSIKWCDYIIHIDNGSSDRTINIVRKYHGRTISTILKDYNERKNLGLKHIITPWVLYIDADERVTPLLRHEIEMLIKSIYPSSAYSIPRRNIYLSKNLQYGGWGGEYVIRLFQTRKLITWKGILHEQPEVDGKISKLTGELIHLSHRDLESMVEKTIDFTQKEVKLRLNANHPPMSWWRFFRVILSEFWLRFIKLHAHKDGTEGMIDGIFQVFNMYIIYARLWEEQINLKALSHK